MTGSAYYIKYPELEELFGPTGAQKITAAFGGRRIYVPAKLHDDHYIVTQLGPELARAFSEHIITGIGGMAVEVPTSQMGDFAGYKRRLMEVAANLDLTEAQAAAELNVHGRTIRRARAKLRAERNRALPPKPQRAGQLSGA